MTQTDLMSRWLLNKNSFYFIRDIYLRIVPTAVSFNRGSALLLPEIPAGSDLVSVEFVVIYEKKTKAKWVEFDLNAKENPTK